MGEVPDREDGRDADDDALDAGSDERDDDELDDDERDDDLDGDDDGGSGDGELVAERAAPIEREALVEVLEFLAKSLVDDPDKVEVEIVDRDGGVTLRLSVAQPDMGKVIGRSGRTARALRTLMRAAGTRADLHTFVEIVEQ